MPKLISGTIKEIIDQSSTTKLFRVAVEQEEPVDYRAGQFVVMDLPIHEKRLKRMRSYSIANAPDQSNLLEFSIVHLEGGAGTTYLFEEAVVGTQLQFKKPAGVFTLPADVSERELVFVCTGTGVAPFRAMIFDLLNQGKTFKSIHLIFGTRTEEGILFREEFEALAAKLPNFRYDVALSRAEHPDFHKGYVHEVYEKYYSETTEDRRFYLCGWSRMIDEAVERLEALGYEKGQVIYELYG